LRKYNCNNECHSMDIAPDDSFILSGHLDGSVKMWGNGDTYEKNFNLHEDKVMNIKIIRNDLFLTLGKANLFMNSLIDNPLVIINFP